jgi:quercetin dioxygenase-like cupin family protein
VVDLIDAPALGQRLGFERAMGEDGEEVLKVTIYVEPGGGVTPHVHPAMEERFTVVAGLPELLAGRRWSAASPGETVVVPAGVRHAFRNRGDEVAHMVAEARPPSTLQPFLEDTAALSRADKITSRGLPKGLDALAAGAVLALDYQDMVKLMFPPFPPPAIQRLLFPPLARLGRRRGYRAGHFAEALDEG